MQRRLGGGQAASASCDGVSVVSACLPAPDSATALPLATELWASLHGIVDLRITKPDMPWPDPDVLIDAALAAVRTAAGPGPQPTELL